jgi:cobyrinic acid a,c-diamide synthase
MKSDEMLTSFVRRSSRGDGSLIEGNRGLYDGVDVHGSFSTAELAKLLRAPVILVLDATKVTRTAAALVLGCQHLDPEVNIAGVILNQVAGKRHEQVLRGAISSYCNIPVLGAVPKDKRNLFPERHLGLVPPQEAMDIAGAVEHAAGRISDCVDVQALWRIAESAAPLGWPVHTADQIKRSEVNGPLVIGIIRDSAFQFYYPENIESLEEKGAIIKEISSLDEHPLPEIDALYIGGGFPETHLEVLSGNVALRDSLRREIENGMPVYAECGGLMYLADNIIGFDKRSYKMVGFIESDCVMTTRLQRFGYVELEASFDNVVCRIRGHEFHNSYIEEKSSFEYAYKVKKYRQGKLFKAWSCGIKKAGTIAGYPHISFLSGPDMLEKLLLR